MRYAILLMLFFTRSTEPMDMMAYLKKPFNEAQWRCNKTDLIENTCGDLHILNKPRIRKWLQK